MQARCLAWSPLFICSSISIAEPMQCTAMATIHASTDSEPGNRSKALRRHESCSSRSLLNYFSEVCGRGTHLVDLEERIDLPDGALAALLHCCDILAGSRLGRHHKHDQAVWAAALLRYGHRCALHDVRNVLCAHPFQLHRRDLQTHDDMRAPARSAPAWI